MSREVVEDLVLSIVTGKLAERGELPGWSRCAAIRDRCITAFFEERLVKEFGVIGEVVGRCEALEYILELAERTPSHLKETAERIQELCLDLRLIDTQMLALSPPRPQTPTLHRSQADSTKRRRA